MTFSFLADHEPAPRLFVSLLITSPHHDFSFSCCRCGKCDANSKNDCKTDCKAVWGGAAKKDRCDVCSGTNQCVDCKDVAFGKNFTDK